MLFASRSPLHRMLSGLVKTGNLTLRCASGTYNCGDGSGPPVVIDVPNPRTEWAIVLNPRLKLGEAYMHGRLIVEEGGVYTFVALLTRNLETEGAPFWVRLLDRARASWQVLAGGNNRPRSARNAEYHYDAGNEFYNLFLDGGWQYSCAYFPPGVKTLEDAQQAKNRHIAAKLFLNAGNSVLDIGSGWGGLALYLERASGADVTGITLSREQLRHSRDLARQEASSARFILKDYRELDGSFDRIVSVGMFEHVGRRHYGAFFASIARLLARDGVAVLHTIGRLGLPCATNPFIRKHIFPGGYLPSLSEIIPAVERARLMVTDLEVWRLHYAETLRHWRTRLRGQWDKAVALKGEAFCRMWEFYFAGSEAAFRHNQLAVFQFQLTRSLDALPVTRDYMAAGEAQLAMPAKVDGRHPVPWQSGESRPRG